MKGKAQEEKTPTSKEILYVYMFFGVIWISACIVLAFRGQDKAALEILRFVSPVIWTPTALYYVTKTVENVFKYNDVFRKKRRETTKVSSIEFNDKEGT